MTDIEIQNVTVDADGLQSAINHYNDGYEPAYGSGGVVLFDDGDPDDAVHVANLEHGEVTQSFAYVDELEQRLEEESEPENVIEFSDGGWHLRLDADAPREVIIHEPGPHPYAVAFDEDAVVDGSPNTASYDKFEGSWDHDWYFDDYRFE